MLVIIITKNPSHKDFREAETAIPLFENDFPEISEEKPPIESREEIFKKVYDAFMTGNLKRRIKNHPEGVKILLKKIGRITISTSSGREVYLNYASGEDLEELCLREFEEYRWPIPDDYKTWVD